MIMKKKLANILSEINLEIDEIDIYGYDIIPVSLAMVHRLQGILSDLRNDLQIYVFPSIFYPIYETICKPMYSRQKRKKYISSKTKNRNC